jgi:hypothetical protein
MYTSKMNSKIYSTNMMQLNYFHSAGDTGGVNIGMDAGVTIDGTAGSDNIAVNEDISIFVKRNKITLI